MPLKNVASRAYVEAIDVQNNTRRSGIAATISVTIETDGNLSTISAGAASGIAEIGTSGVYSVPLTAAKMNGSVIAVIASTTAINVLMSNVVLYTEGGTLDSPVSSRLAASNYVAPPSVAGLATAAALSGVAADITGIRARVPAGGTLTTTADLALLATATAVTGLATGVSKITDRLPSTGTLARISDLPDISVLATKNDVPDLMAISHAVLGTNLMTITDAAVGSLRTLMLMQTNARISGNQLNVYEVDGKTIHTQYDVVTTSEDARPIIGMQPR